MVTEELLAYIKRQQSNRVPEESIRAILLSNGWLKVDVDKAFDSLFKVEESKISTAQDLKSKIAGFAPSIQNTSPQFGFQQEQTHSPVQPSSSMVDSYREPIETTPKEKVTSQSVGTPLGKSIPDDLKERLSKISSGSIFAPQREVVNPVVSESVSTSNPLLSHVSKPTPSFEERLMSESSAAVSPSQFPIKRETIQSQPSSGLHMIEDKPLVAPEDHNRLYSNFKGGSPYSPSMDKFNNPSASSPVKKSYFGKITAIVFFVGIIGGGYYLYSQKPDLVRGFVDMIISKFSESGQNNTVTLEDTSTVDTVQQNIDTSSNTDKTDSQNTKENPVTENTQTLPSVESTLKSISLKVPGYVGVKSTAKGVCSNISSGIAKDVLVLRQVYGQNVYCLDDMSGFALLVPYQNSGEFMCIDISQEIILTKSIPKSARCQ